MNGIKFSDAESGALRTGGANLAPKNESVTDPGSYWTSIEPPTGGYTIYLNKAANGPSIYVAENDAQLISLTNSIAGASYTTVEECFTYFNGQSDKTCFNIEYGGIVTDGLALNLDAGFTPSYPRSDTTWKDISGNGNNGTLTNGPTFNSNNGGSIVFDGVDDYGQLISKMFQGVNDFTFSCIFKNTKSTYTFYGGPIYTEWTTGAGTNNTIYIAIGEGETATSSSPFRVSFSFQVSNTQYHNHSNTRIPVNQTAAITCIREGVQAKIYIDGVLDSTTTCVSGPLDTKTNSPLIAGVGYGARFKGDIYTIQTYNRALSATEVLQNYNATKGRYGL